MRHRSRGRRRGLIMKRLAHGVPPEIIREEFSNLRYGTIMRLKRRMEMRRGR